LLQDADLTLNSNILKLIPIIGNILQHSSFTNYSVS